MKIHGKIVRTNRAGYQSIKASVCHSFRDGYGRPRNKVLASLKTVRSTELASVSVQQAFWRELDAALLRIGLAHDVMRNDLDAIRAKFAKEICPRPGPTLRATPTASTSGAPKFAKLKRKYPIL